MSDTVSEVSEPVIRTFSTGATRNLDVNKLDFEGFYSPLAMESFAKYMHTHRMQKDGTLRAADNWQKGIGFDVYMKSMFRHFFDAWKIHRGHKAFSPEDGHELTIDECLNGLSFNVNGYMHEFLKAEAKVDLEPLKPERECHVCATWSNAPLFDKSNNHPCVATVDLAAVDNECDNCCPVCPLPVDSEQSDTQDDGDDMVDIRLHRNNAIVAGVLFVLMFGSCAVIQILSLLSKM